LSFDVGGRLSESVSYPFPMSLHDLSMCRPLCGSLPQVVVVDDDRPTYP